MTARLRLYTEPDEETADRPNADVSIRLGDLLPMAAMAQRMNFIWLKDFLDDEVCISEDLHDVLQNVRGIRPTAS